MNNIDYLKEKLDKLNPKERQELDDYLLNGISKDADNAKKNYGLITSEQYLEKAQELKDNWGKMQGLSSGYPSKDASKRSKSFVCNNGNDTHTANQPNDVYRRQLFRPCSTVGFST